MTEIGRSRRIPKNATCVHHLVVYNSSQIIAEGGVKCFTSKKNGLNDKITLQNKNKSLELLSSAALARRGGTGQSSLLVTCAASSSSMAERLSLPVLLLPLLQLLLMVGHCTMHMVILENAINYFTWDSTIFITDTPCSLLHVLPPSTLTRSAFEQLGSK